MQREIHIITAFPDACAPYFSHSLMKRAIARKALKVVFHDLWQFRGDEKERLDARPFGGGPGMVLRLEPIYRALQKALRGKKRKTRVIVPSLRGTPFAPGVAKRLARYERLIFIAGHYEGIDERVIEHLADEEISIGSYVLSGGELPSLVIADAVMRYVPGFLGNESSLEDIQGSHPSYTRPETFSPRRGVHWRVPRVLRSGNHAAIKAWRDGS
jgi:tRNA (guanine37-N1)-methyltransferase